MAYQSINNSAATGEFYLFLVGKRYEFHHKSHAKVNNFYKKLLNRVVAAIDRLRFCAWLLLSHYEN